MIKQRIVVMPMPKSGRPRAWYVSEWFGLYPIHVFGTKAAALKYARSTGKDSTIDWIWI